MADCHQCDFYNREKISIVALIVIIFLLTTMMTISLGGTGVAGGPSVNKFYQVSLPLSLPLIISPNSHQQHPHLEPHCHGSQRYLKSQGSRICPLILDNCYTFDHLKFDQPSNSTAKTAWFGRKCRSEGKH